MEKTNLKDKVELNEDTIKHLSLNIIRLFLEDCLKSGFFVFKFKDKTIELDSKKDIEEIIDILKQSNQQTLDFRLREAQNHLHQKRPTEKVDFIYRGEEWIAEANKRTLAAVTCHNKRKPEDTMNWFAPTDKICEIERKIILEERIPTEKELLEMTGVIDSFRSLLFKKPEDQISIAEALRKVIQRESSQPSETTSKRKLIKPTKVTDEMIKLAKTDDPWHFANNINSMIKFGYCSECGLIPSGCRREGCQSSD